MRIKIIYWIVVFLVFILGFLVGIISDYNLHISYHISKQFKLYQLRKTLNGREAFWNPEIKTIEGEKTGIKTGETHLTYLYFWDAHCKYCKNQWKELNDLFIIYKNNLTIYAINSYNTLDEIQNFLKEQITGFHVIAEKEGTLFRFYKVQSIPYGILIGKNGKIININIHVKNLDKILRK